MVTCQCCWTLCHMATLPVLLMVTSWMPVKKSPSTGIFMSKDAGEKGGRERGSEREEGGREREREGERKNYFVSRSDWIEQVHCVHVCSIHMYIIYMYMGSSVFSSCLPWGRPIAWLWLVHVVHVHVSLEARQQQWIVQECLHLLRWASQISVALSDSLTH